MVPAQVSLMSERAQTLKGTRNVRFSGSNFKCNKSEYTLHVQANLRFFLIIDNKELS
jgi:hypothetical protein